MKYYILIFCTLILAFEVYAIQVTIPNASQPAGKTFELPIEVENLDDQNIFQYEFTLIFNPSVLSAIDVSYTETLSAVWQKPTAVITDGAVKVTAQGYSPLSGAGTLINLKFQVNQSASVGTTIPLQLANFKFNEGTPPVEIQNGSFQVSQDNSAPVFLSAPSIERTSANSATIVWETDEPVSAVLEYGIDQNLNLFQKITEFRQFHRVKLTDLNPSTTYYFRVSVTDANGNGPTQSNIASFFTSNISLSLPQISLDPGETIEIPVIASDLTGLAVKNVEATINYDPKILTFSHLNTNDCLIRFWRIPLINVQNGEINFRASGTTNLSGSGPVVNIVFKISSQARIGTGSALNFKDASLNEGSIRISTVNGQFEVQDTKKPVLIVEPFIDKVTSNSALIRWKTDEKSTSVVNYGTSPGNYEHLQQSAALTSDHWMLLNGLIPEKSYYFKISSVDSSGNGPTESAEYEFTTERSENFVASLDTVTTIPGTNIVMPFYFKNATGSDIKEFFCVIKYDPEYLSVTGISKHNTIIDMWPMPELDIRRDAIIIRSGGGIHLRQSGILLNINFEVNKNINNVTHTDLDLKYFVLNDGLPKVTTFNGRVKFNIDIDTSKPRILFGPIVDNISATSASVYWITDKPATSQVQFGPDDSYGQSVHLNHYVTEHLVHLNNLEPDSTYHFIALSTAQFGNEPIISRSSTFNTTNGDEIVLSIPQIRQKPGSVFELPVRITALNGKKVTRLKFNLNFKSNLLLAGTASTSGTIAQLWGAPLVEQTNNKLQIQMNGNVALPDTGTILKIQFQIKNASPVGSVAPIYFSEVSTNNNTITTRFAHCVVYVIDGVLPAISQGPELEKLNPGTAFVFWETKEPATSVIEYGLTPDLEFEVRSNFLEQSHIFELPALKPGTQYYYRISSWDAAGNGPVSSAQQSFVTDNRPTIVLSLPQIGYDIGESFYLPVTINGISMENTFYSADFTLNYDPGVLKFNAITEIGTITRGWDFMADETSDTTIAIQVRGNWQVAQEGYLVKISMTPHNPNRYNETTRLSITNASINDNPNGVELLNGFFTLRENPRPKILLGPGVNKISKNGAQIFWVTNRSGTSAIEYGETEEYDLSLSNSQSVTYHSFDIYGLNSNTTYHYQVKTETQLGVIESEDLTFITSNGNEVSSWISDTTLAIGRTFSLPIMVPNLSQKNIQQFELEVGFDSELLSPGSISIENTLAENWEIEIKELTSSTIRAELKRSNPLRGGGKLCEIQGAVKANVDDGEKTYAILNDLTFNYGLIQGSTQNGSLTLSDLNRPQFVSGPTARAITPTSATIEWLLDEPATGLIEFGPDSVIDQRWQVRQFRKDHQANLTNLIPGTIYAYRVAIVDTKENAPCWTKTYYFKTENPTIELEIPELTLGIGEVYDVPVFIRGLNGEQITDVSFRLNFDGSKLVAMNAHSETSMTADWSTPEFETEIHSVSVALKGETAVNKDGILTWISFLVHSNASAGEKTALNFSNVRINKTEIAPPEQSAQITLSTKPSVTRLKVTVPDTTLQAGAWCLLPVRVTNLSKRAIFKANFEIKYNATLLDCEGAMRAGMMIPASANIENEFQQNSLRVTIESPTALSGGGVMLRILFKVRQDAHAGHKSPLNFKSFHFNGGRPEVTTTDGGIILIQWPDIINGYVVERDKINPIPGATVKLKGQNIDYEKTIETDNIGRFVFSGLDTSQNNLYRITVTKKGYSKPEPLHGIRTGQYILRIPLLLPDGKIAGKVTSPSGFPISGAEITVNDFQGADQTHYATTQTGFEGTFQIDGLNREEPFQLLVQKDGFKKLVLNHIFPDTLLHCVPDPYFGTVSGKVNLVSTGNLNNFKVILIEKATSTGYDSVNTDSTGHFKFEDVLPGLFQIKTDKPGFLPVDTLTTIEVVANTDIKVYPNMEPAIPDHFEIWGSTFTANNARVRYKYRTWASTGQTMELPSSPRWSVSPLKAGYIYNGAFIPNSNYIGPVSVIVNSPKYQVSDSLNVNLFAPLNTDSEGFLEDNSGFSLTFNAGTVREDTLLFLGDAQLPQLNFPSHTWKSIGKAYEIQPRDLIFEKPVRMTIPVQIPADSNELRLGRWDFETSQWIIIDDFRRINSNLVELDIYRTGLYVQLDASNELGIFDIKLRPNPFSTEIDSDGDGEAGLAIHLTVSSKFTSRPVVTIKIYNLLGDLVRELWVKEPVEKLKPMVVRWNGMTDHHLLARNGRYLLRMIIEDASGKKEYLKSIVLIK